MEKAVVNMLAISYTLGFTFRFQHKSKVEDEGF